MLDASGAATTLVLELSNSRKRSPTSRLLPAVLLVGLLIAAAPAVLADEDVHERHVTAHNDAANCVSDAEPCFDVAESQGLIEDDDELVVTFENNGTQPHSLLLARAEDADPENGTPSDDAFLSLGPIEPGETVEATTEIPNGTEWIHLFCDVADHEEQGMHETRNVYPGGSVQEAENQTVGEPGGDQIPSASATAMVALAIGAAVVADRRRG